MSLVYLVRACVKFQRNLLQLLFEVERHNNNAIQISCFTSCILGLIFLAPIAFLINICLIWVQKCGETMAVVF